MSQIASVSLTTPLADLAGELGRSFSEYGFAVVRDHGIPADLIARAEARSRAFFALPEAVKMQYHLKGTGGARGYTSFGIERAKDARVHDLKEFWHVGRTLPPGDPLERSEPELAERGPRRRHAYSPASMSSGAAATVTVASVGCGRCCSGAVTYFFTASAVPPMASWVNRNPNFSS